MLLSSILNKTCLSIIVRYIMYCTLLTNFYYAWTYLYFYGFFVCLLAPDQILALAVILYVLDTLLPIASSPLSLWSLRPHWADRPNSSITSSEAWWVWLYTKAVTLSDLYLSSCILSISLLTLSLSIGFTFSVKLLTLTYCEFNSL